MNKLAMTSMVIGAVALAPALASADQCAYVTKAQADDALQLVAVGDDIVEFCEPCGEGPQSVKVDTVTSAETGFENTWEVSVNGQGIDLAYTFIANGDGKWVNLSKMVDCPSEGVSYLLDEQLVPLAGDKEDGIGGDAAGGGCSVGGTRESGAGLLFGLALAGLAIVYRRRRA